MSRVSLAPELSFDLPVEFDQVVEQVEGARARVEDAWTTWDQSRIEDLFPAGVSLASPLVAPALREISARAVSGLTSLGLPLAAAGPMGLAIQALVPMGVSILGDIFSGDDPPQPPALVEGLDLDDFAVSPLGSDNAVVVAARALTAPELIRGDVTGEDLRAHLVTGLLPGLWRAALDHLASGRISDRWGSLDDAIRTRYGGRWGGAFGVQSPRRSLALFAAQAGPVVLYDEPWTSRARLLPAMYLAVKGRRRAQMREVLWRYYVLRVAEGTYAVADALGTTCTGSFAGYPQRFEAEVLSVLVPDLRYRITKAAYEDYPKSRLMCNRVALAEQSLQHAVLPVPYFDDALSRIVFSAMTAPDLVGVSGRDADVIGWLGGGGGAGTSAAAGGDQVRARFPHLDAGWDLLVQIHEDPQAAIAYAYQVAAKPAWRAVVNVGIAQAREEFVAAGAGSGGRRVTGLGPLLSMQRIERIEAQREKWVALQTGKAASGSGGLGGSGSKWGWIAGAAAVGLGAVAWARPRR